MNQEQLQAPFAVMEPDDSETAFFSDVELIVNDRFDILWQEQYVGYDSAGRKFHLRRVVKKPRWFERLLNTRVEYLEIERIEPQAQPDEAAGKVRRWLERMLQQWPEIAQQLSDVTAQRLAASGLPELLAIGLRFDAIAAKTTRPSRKRD